MHSSALNSVRLFCFIAQVHASEVASRQSDVKESMDSDSFVDRMADRMLMRFSDRLYDEVLQHLQLHSADLDSTALGKPAQVSSPLAQSRIYAIPASSAASKARTSSLRTTPVQTLQKKSLQNVEKKEYTPDLGRYVRMVDGIPQENARLKESLTKRETWDAIAKASAELANAEKLAEELPYDIKYYVHGGNFGGEQDELGSHNMQYMENRIQSALKNHEDQIQSVDVRLNIEGKDRNAKKLDPKTYSMEVTVKANGNRPSRIVLSNPKHAQGTFIEAVDEMHDTLKHTLDKKFKMKIAKARHARRMGKAEFADEEYGDDTDDTEVDENLPSA